MLVLALSTSTSRGSVALLDGQTVLARAAYAELRSHAERLFGGIEEVCVTAGVTRAELAMVACDVGPGSFTGVRVGVAAANGIAFALGIPALGVVSLEAVAHATFDVADGEEVFAAIDAQKDELYLGRYRRTRGAPAIVGDLRAVSRDVARAEIEAAQREGTLVAGEIARAMGIVGAVCSESSDLPDAAHVGRIAALGAAETDGPRRFHAVSPVYVRPPDITLPRR